MFSSVAAAAANSFQSLRSRAGSRRGASPSRPSSSSRARPRDPSVPKPRVPSVAFTGVPRHWIADSAAATHIANGVNLLFPAGERFFVRAVKRYLGEVSPELAAQVKGFFGQEGRHAQAHERFFDTLRAQGFEIDTILARYERVAFDFVEVAAPPALRLSVTVALEHFTALLAEDALVDGLPYCDPRMRALFEWHAVEELEHKSVAFDVMQEVMPSYALRMAGLVVATILLGGFWAFATNELLKQEGKSLLDASREMRDLRKLAQELQNEDQLRLTKPIVTELFVRGIREYAKPNFHPTDRDHADLIAKTLARLRAEGVVESEARA